MGFLDNLLYYLLCLYVITMPLIPYKTKIKGIPLSGDMVLALVFLVYFVKLIFTRETKVRFIKGLYDFFHCYLSIFIFLLAFVMLGSTFYAYNKSMALQESARFITYILLFFMIKYECFNKRYLDGLLRSFIGIVSLLGVMGIVQGLTGIGLDKKFIGYNYAKYKIAVTMDNPTWYGPFLVMAIFPIFMLALNEKNRRKKVFYYASSIILSINLFLTFSRNALIGFAIAFIILIVIYSWKLIVGFGGFSLLLLFVPSINQRVRDIANPTQDLSRLYLWNIALKMIKDHPIRGVGNGNFTQLYDTYVKKYPEYAFYGYKEYAVHNAYLKIQSELGIFGTISFLGILVSIVLRLKEFKNIAKDNFYRSFYMGYLASVVGYMFMSISDNLFTLPKVTVFFWFLIAIEESYRFNVQKSSLY